MPRLTAARAPALLTAIVARCAAMQARVGDAGAGDLPERNGRCWKPDELVQNWETELHVSPDYIEHLRSLPPIPKKIHLVWTGPNLLQMRAGLARHGVQQLKRLNPNWEFRVYTLAEVDEYIKGHVSPSDWEMVRDAPVTPKTDLFRILKMYHEGGYYQDVDRLYNIPLDAVVGKDTKVLLPMNGAVDFASDLMASAPGNRLYKRSLEMYLCKMREESEQGLTDWKNLRGEALHIAAIEAAGTYFAAVMESVFGRPIWGPFFHERDGDQGASFAARLVQLINGTGYMRSQRNEWCREMFVDFPGCNQDPWISEFSKEAMWDEAALKQWDAN